MSAPQRLNSALTRNWVGACSRWAPRELAADKDLFTSTLTVKRSTSRFFMYEEHRAGKLEDASSNIGGCTELVQQAAGDFLAKVDAATGDSSAGYCYWTSPLSSAAPELLSRVPGFGRLHELSPLETHGRKDGRDAVNAQGLQRANASSPVDPRGPSIWIGSAGSATQAHYDVADNVIVQLHGTKRLRCYSPAAATPLHVFPDAHPRARKSQVNFDEPDHVRFPLFSALPPPALDVTLHPGDALSVPAFWFHHVENDPLGPSVSLNLFAPSAALIAAQPIFAHRIPAPAFSAKSTGSEVVQSVLCHLAGGLLDGLREWDPQMISPDAFVQQMLASRYAPLLEGGPNVAETVATSTAAASLNADAVANALVDADQMLGSVLQNFQELRSAMLAEYEGDGGDISADYVDGVVELIAAHLLELWAVQLVGAANVGSLLSSIVKR